jgi:hypothetical protein
VVGPVACRQREFHEPARQSGPPRNGRRCRRDQTGGQRQQQGEPEVEEVGKSVIRTFVK